MALHKKGGRTTGKVALQNKHSVHKFKNVKKNKKKEKIKLDKKKKKNPWQGVIGDGVCLDL